MKQALKSWRANTVLIGALTFIVLGSFAFPKSEAQRETLDPYGFGAGRPLVIAGMPTPDQMQMVYENEPFTVPANSYFVVTGIGRSLTSPPEYRIDVVFNGVPVLKTSYSYNAHGTDGMVTHIPPGLKAPAGTIVEAVATKEAGAVIFGYVAQMR